MEVMVLLRWIRGGEEASCWIAGVTASLVETDAGRESNEEIPHFPPEKEPLLCNPEGGREKFQSWPVCLKVCV